MDVVSHKVKILQTSGKAPQPRANHASSLVENNLYIFGGWNGTKRLNDMYFVNLDSFVWTFVDYNINKPTARAGMPMLNYKEYLILFGGSGTNSSYLNDLFFYDISNKIWFKPNNVLNQENIPSERAGHTAVIDDRLIYIYGGGGPSAAAASSIHILEIDPEPKILIKRNSKIIKDKLVSNLKKLFNNAFLSDISFKVKEQSIYCHKIILSLLSEKFNAMFTLGLKESKTSVIEITNYKYKHFYFALKYLYSGEIDEEENIFNLLDFIEILKISDEYMLYDIKLWCEDVISKLVDNENFFIINFFSKKFCAENLAEYCKWYYRQNGDNISVLENSISDLSILSVQTLDSVSEK